MNLSESFINRLKDLAGIKTQPEIKDYTGIDYISNPKYPHAFRAIRNRDDKNIWNIIGQRAGGKAGFLASGLLGAPQRPYPSFGTIVKTQDNQYLATLVKNGEQIKSNSIEDILEKMAKNKNFNVYYPNRDI
jgi:hypothetical protein